MAQSPIRNMFQCLFLSVLYGASSFFLKVFIKLKEVQWIEIKKIKNKNLSNILINLKFLILKALNNLVLQ